VNDEQHNRADGPASGPDDQPTAEQPSTGNDAPT
jgi:hypothetical protein